MTLRKKFKRIQGRFIDFVENSIAAGDTVPSPPSTNAGPDSRASDPLAVPAIIIPAQHSPLAANCPAATEEDLKAEGTGNWPKLRSFLQVLRKSPAAFGPLNVVIDGLVECIEIYEGAANNRKEYNELQIELESIFAELRKLLAQTSSPVLTASMERLCQSIQKEIGHLREKQDREKLTRRMEAEDDSDAILVCYHRIQNHLQRLSLNLNISLWEIVDEQVTDTRPNRLSSSLSACYNSSQAAELKRGACTPGTRVDVLGQMHGWIHNPTTGIIYWLNGMAGTGKTTISYTLCAELEASSQLGASFFCSRSLPECRDVNKIIPSIAYQLARFSRPFRSALSQVLEKEPDVHTRLLRIQFESLIVKPLNSVRQTLPEDLVVVLDALDECDSQQSTGRILEALFMVPDLPIKFFISSRPEPEIRDQMQKQGDNRSTARLVLHELEKGMVQADIETYLRQALSPIQPTEPQIETLVERAGILFIYAATVVRYIGSKNFRQNPRARLEKILDASTLKGDNPYKEIDELYTLILKAAIDDHEINEEEREDIKRILYTAVCAREPLTINALSGLLGMHDTERVKVALQPLWSVLHVVELSGLVATLHASFPDYMFDPKRSKGYYCDPTLHDLALSGHCFDCIKAAAPQFNICRLESSYIPDEMVPDLGIRVEAAISSELSYACRYWATHLNNAQESFNMIEKVEDFMSARLLLWMEVMNLKKCMHSSVKMIPQAESWCLRQGCSQDLMELIHDAWRFMAAFILSPLSRTTAHIYVSMLPFWPASRPISKCYGKRMRGRAVPQGTAIAQRQLNSLAMNSLDSDIGGLAWSPDSAQIVVAAGSKIFLLDGLNGQTVMGPLKGHTWPVTSIAFSPDGTRIASGSRDNTVRVWNLRSGLIMPFVLKGHNGPVTSISFSPDGSRIVSCSEDKTIRVWSIRKGQMVLGPLKGHSERATSIAFSPDGAFIASGSHDNTIILWDAHTGHTVLSPFKGHKSLVLSVAFSPDSTSIVSGSLDHTVRVWAVQNGQTVLGPLEGHAGQVTSVAFSPDGTRIVSGSSDSTLLVWDVQSGQTVLGPIQGHTAWVTSVAYSPDGTRFASCASDKTVRIWYPRDRQIPPSLHDKQRPLVTSVAFSPDGTRIASGSHKNDILVWDGQSGQTVLGPLTGHSERVTSVAFSPDGNRLISGSRDHTIRVWDATTGQAVLGPFEGHTGSVNSVVFSPGGASFVSGSDDKTVIVWNASVSNDIISGPFRGHTSFILSVQYSPDGTRIISGSNDRTIRVWDIKSGHTIIGPLEGHTGQISSVAFSPDGSRIASGSHDATIRIWDSQSGLGLLGLLQGHTSDVNSIAFSPDGARIVSGSDDCTICLWEIQNERLVLGPLKGHTEWITSVAYSPDGTRVVSRSGDNTVRVWDVRGKNVATRSSDPALPALVRWRLDSNGWVTDRKSRLLVWVPPDLRGVILSPRNILSISTEADIRLNFEDVWIGESWSECYKPE